MIWSVLADLVLVVHLAFLLFVAAGGLAVLRWPRLAWAHVPAVVWGVLIEYAGWICPLTPLENRLRRAGGGAGYEGGFIEHYVTAILYPAGLDRRWQIGLGTLALVINAGIYWLLLARRRRARRLTASTADITGERLG
ncbi:MAG: DUF2784 domain-containing protein [Gemmatimonadales bacterium]